MAQDAPDIHPPLQRKRTLPQDESLGDMLRKGIVKHQLGLSVNLALFVALAYGLFPSLRERMSAFFTLSYASDRQPGMYGQGPRDVYLIISFIVAFTALRALCLDYALLPLAGWCGIRKEKGRVRFAEQAYLMAYYAIYWSWGVAIFVRDTPSDVKSIEGLLVSLWTGFPRLYLDSTMKVYYLTQFAFWLQQIFVIHIEDRRKDHYQMLSHHIITCFLLGFSYPYRQWRVGNAVLICMDLVDSIFSCAKILRYTGLQTACDAAFGAFVILWLVMRHGFYLTICYSIYAHINEVTMSYGLYSLATGTKISEDGGTNVLDNLLQPFLRPEARVLAFNANIRWLFLGLLGALQCITIAWFFMICRVVVRVIRGQGADDTRSDDEEEEEEVDTVDFTTKSHDLEVASSAEEKRFIEVEATSENMSYSSRRSPVPTSNSVRKSKGISSGLNLNGHKDILNRIGCLSEEQLAREREKREGSMSPMPSSANGPARR